MNWEGTRSRRRKHVEHWTATLLRAVGVDGTKMPQAQRAVVEQIASDAMDEAIESADDLRLDSSLALELVVGIGAIGATWEAPAAFHESAGRMEMSEVSRDLVGAMRFKLVAVDAPAVITGAIRDGRFVGHSRLSRIRLSNVPKGNS